MNMQDRMKRTPVTEQAPEVRAKNFEEVCLGYTEEQAIKEANRCLGCKNPKCVEGCPVSVNIPGFIAKAKEGDFEAAAKEIAKYSALPAVCGRVCPQESQCEGKCVLGIKGEAVAIGKLEKFTADWSRKNKIDLSDVEAPNGKRVAVIGSGPAGLTCAGDLAKKGYDVTIFEALHEAGGVLVYGIPEFRLPKEDVVKAEIENIKKLGVKIETNVVIGRTITIDELMKEEKFDAVFIGSGAGLPKFMGINGENANGVFSANEFLTRVNLMKAFKEEYETPVRAGRKVAVVGGGNVAMDAARSAKHYGSKDVFVAYRRDFDNMTATKAEIHEAIEEGVEFMTYKAPIKIVDEGIILADTKKVVNKDGTTSLITVEDSEKLFECDSILVAVSQVPRNTIVSNNKGLDVNNRGLIMTDNSGHTTRDGVFACGDVTHGAKTVIEAVVAAKIVATSIDEYLK